MNTSELKTSLHTAENVMNSVKALFPPETLDKAVDLLGKLGEAEIKLIHALLATANSTVTVDDVKAGVANTQDALTKLDQMMKGGCYDHIVQLCHNLQNRSVVLALVARVL